jgi:putative phosphoesterase
MRLLIASDSHGEKGLLQEIVKRVQPDVLLHCGDFCTEVEELPSITKVYVQGNCDFASAPQNEIYEAEGWRFYLTHGHHEQVKSSLLPLCYRAQEVEAHVACFGHSHVPICEQEQQVLLINPGSVSYPRGGFPYPSYVVATLDPETIEVRYYQTDGKPITQLGGTYSR